MVNKFFSVIFKGSFIDSSVEELRNKFEFGIDTNNSNIFLFKSEIPALISIIKRFGLYFVSILFVVVFYFLGTVLGGFSLSSSTIVLLFNFFFTIVLFLVSLLLILYFVNILLTLKRVL